MQGLCRALLRDSAEAEDAAQQVFLSAYRALLGGAVVREPAAWLATIARNECGARARRRMRQPLALDLDETVSESDPVADAIRRADLRALWLAISALPPLQRDALLMREFAGLSYAELAHALAVSEPAVEALLSRARARLRRHLGKAFASLGGPSSLPAAFGRLLGGLGSAGGAAKLTAAAATVAVVAGGADVGPRAVDRPVTHAPAYAKRAPVVLRRAVQPIVPAAAPLRSVVQVVRHDRSERESARREVSRESGEGDSQPVVTIATTSSGERDGHSGDDSSDGSGD